LAVLVNKYDDVDDGITEINNQLFIQGVLDDAII